ncbi:MAG TPA: hypothetical protein VLD65_13465 [Anaerolineales bacterium]|nr:hypothetical protein [Anaerolineales bacterium]
MTNKMISIVALLVMSILVISCTGAAKTPVTHEWPVYVHIKQTRLSLAEIKTLAPGSCKVHAVDLIGTWVAAATPEKDPFSFTDVDGKSCQGTFDADVLPLFTTGNLWYSGAPSCRTCHGPQVEISYARLDLSSYQGILAGDSRESSTSKGEDILGGGNWEEAQLYKMLHGREMPPNQPEGLDPKGPLVFAGTSR